MNEQDKEIEKAFPAFKEHIDNEALKSLECSDIVPNKIECKDLGFEPKGIIIVPEGIGLKEIELLQEYPNILVMPIEDIKEVTDVLIGVGKSFKESLELINEVLILTAPPPVFDAQEAGKRLAESMKEIEIHCRELGKEKYINPIKSHNDRFVRRSNNKSRW